MKRVAAIALLAVAAIGCTEKNERPEGGLSGTCGLREIAKKVNEKKVGEEFLLDGVEIAKTQHFRGRFIATINAPYEVNEAYRQYQDKVKEAGWNIVTQETEGFEAEIYLENERYLGAVQIRTSTCEGKAVVYVSMLDRDEAAPDN